MGKYQNTFAALLIAVSAVGQTAAAEEPAQTQSARGSKDTSSEKPSSPEATIEKTEDSAATQTEPNEQGPPIKIIQTGSKMPDKAKPEKIPPAADATHKEPLSADVQTAPTPVAPEWHRLQTRLTGSLCLSCLRELESILKRVYGVQMAKVEKAPVQYNSAISPELGGWANGTIIYDVKKLPLDDLRSVIKQNGYHPFRIVDSYVEGIPSEADLKFRR